MTDKPEDGGFSETVCPPGHVEYLSEAPADNAVTLHGFKNPHCPGIRWFRCGDHYHVGHKYPRLGQQCKEGEDRP